MRNKNVQPREKMLHYGAGALTDTELLALFLRTGYKNMPVVTFAQNLLREFGSLYHLLSADYGRFEHVTGIGIAKYAQLHGIAELAKRYYNSKGVKTLSFRHPRHVREYVQSQLSNEEREIFLTLFLNNQHQVIKCERLFSGTIDRVEVHPREIVRAAIKSNAAAVIIAHNHPSGFAEPSKADREMTQRIAQACLMMDINVLDHLVIGHGEYVSFAERGWI